MSLHKDTQNNIHDDMDGKASHLLPKGCVEITQVEADAINTVKQHTAFNALTYAQKRQGEYPPMADYLDAMVKGDVTQQQAYIDACLAVKARYPKI